MPRCAAQRRLLSMSTRAPIQAVQSWAAPSVNGYSGNQELTLKAAGLTRPSTSTAAIYVTAELPNKESANDAYTLVGTLDVEPDSFAVDSVAALFLHTEPDSYQLTVTGDPMPELEQITYSGSSGGGQGMTQNAAWIDETGKVSFTRFYNAASGSNTEFIADPATEESQSAPAVLKTAQTPSS